MNATRPDPRAHIAAHLETQASPKAAAFAAFVRGEATNAPVPCWGAIFDRFATDYASNAERLEALDKLIAAGDRRALLLFLELAKADEGLRAGLIARAPQLPPSVQRALVALDGMDQALAPVADQLVRSAQQLIGDDEARRKELQEHDARVAELLSFRFFSPDDPAPRVAIEAALQTRKAAGPPA